MSVRNMLAQLALGVALMLALVSEGMSGPRWQAYVHPQFGTRIAVPADILPGSEAVASGAAFFNRNARLEVSARRVPGVASAGDLRRLIAGTPGYERVTYNVGGGSWLVVSGYRGERIFYEKFHIARGAVQGFSFQYPAAQRSLYDPLVEAMENSFRPG